MSNTHLGHKARKRFWAKLLNDDYVIDQIVSAIAPNNDDIMVEIGPGLGALTEPVCDVVEHLNVVELDRDLAKRLREHPFMSSKLNVIEADALQFDFTELAKQGPLKVFGNLPYNISTPLMFHLFTFTNQIKDMHFMLQKEVVNRLAARPGHKNYGRLSVMAQYYCTVVPVIEVPPEAFTPPPKVDSAVVRLIPHQIPPVEVNELKALEKVTALAFNQRRKTIRNSLKSVIDADVLTSIGIDPVWRAEGLSLAQFALIANHATFGSET